MGDEAATNEGPDGMKPPGFGGAFGALALASAMG